MSEAEKNSSIANKDMWTGPRNPFGTSAPSANTVNSLPNSLTAHGTASLGKDQQAQLSTPFENKPAEWLEKTIDYIDTVKYNVNLQEDIKRVFEKEGIIGEYLYEALAGNCRTSVVACVDPGSKTEATLRVVKLVSKLDIPR